MSPAAHSENLRSVPSTHRAVQTCLLLQLQGPGVFIGLWEQQACYVPCIQIKHPYNKMIKIKSLAWLFKNYSHTSLSIMSDFSCLNIVFFFSLSLCCFHVCSLLLHDMINHLVWTYISVSVSICQVMYGNKQAQNSIIFRKKKSIS